MLSLQMALKISDLGHIAAPLALHLKWVAALEQEFFLQGDAERSLGLPISPLCDRTKEGVTKSQVGFFEFVVSNLFKAFCTKFPACKPLWKSVNSNYKYWCHVAKEAAADKATRCNSHSSSTCRGSDASISHEASESS